MSDVIYLDEIRRRKGIDSAHATESYERPITQVPNNEGLVRIYNFNPDETDELIIHRLVYNEPSVLDSYYLMYRTKTVIVVRYEDAVVVRDMHTMDEIIVVVKRDGLWYSKVTDNVDT